MIFAKYLSIDWKLFLSILFPYESTESTNIVYIPNLLPTRISVKTLSPIIAISLDEYGILSKTFFNFVLLGLLPEDVNSKSNCSAIRLILFLEGLLLKR